MGRKIDMKKIQDITKCQVTFSKRRSSLMKKANEIAVCCDIDVAFVAFSPSGRISNFCNQRRIEDVLNHYVNLPADQRLEHITNVEAKLRKLRQLNHISGDTSKIQYLDMQIENLELQIKKGGLELQILETDLRDYELDPEQESSLHQVSWCERKLHQSLQKILARRDALSRDFAVYMQPSFMMDQIQSDNQNGLPPFTSFNNFNENDLASSRIQIPCSGEILMQLDPWISPYSARARENLLQDLLDKAKFLQDMNQAGPSNIFPVSSNMSNFLTTNCPVILESGTTSNSFANDFHGGIPQQLPQVVDQTMMTDQTNVGAWTNFSKAMFSDAFDISAQSFSKIQSPRFTYETTMTTDVGNMNIPQYSHHDKTENSSQFSILNFNEFTNLGAAQIGQVNMHNGNYNLSNGNADVEDLFKVSHNQMHQGGQSDVHPPNEVCEDAQFDNLPRQGTLGDNTYGTSNVEKSNSWEWENLLPDDNFNFGDFA